MEFLSLFDFNIKVDKIREKVSGDNFYFEIKVIKISFKYLNKLNFITLQVYIKYTVNSIAFINSSRIITFYLLSVDRNKTEES